MKDAGMPRFNIGSADLSEDDIDWFKVACNLSGESIRAKIGHIITGHLIRFRSQYVRKVDYVARQYGVTWEEAFILLRQKSPPFTEEDLVWVRSQPPLALREQEVDQKIGYETLREEDSGNSINESKS